MGEAAFFAFGEAADLAVFGLGAFGFFVGPPLADFLAFEGDLPLEAATADEVVALVFGAAVFFSAFAAVLALAPAVVVLFLTDFFAAAEGFFTALVFSADVAAEVELPARLVGVFFVLPPALDFFFSAPVGFVAEAPEEVEAASLKDPEAPFPFVCTKAPETTDDFKYFLMNGATFSASTL